MLLASYFALMDNLLERSALLVAAVIHPPFLKMSIVGKR